MAITAPRTTSKPSRKKRFDFRPGSHVPHPVRYGTLVLLLFALFLYWGFNGGALPFISGGGRTVRMIVASGEDLRAQKTPVRVDGINVGTVTGTHRTANGKAVVVTMNITNNSVHLSSNASAQVYWRTLLGFNYYVALNPGNSSTPLVNNVIPESRTGVQVELDQVIDTLTPTSRGGIQQFFDQVSQAFKPGNQAGAAIDNVAPAMVNVGPALNAFQGEYPGDLTNTVHQANRLLSNLQTTDQQLGSLVDSTDTTFGATSAQQGSIDATLEQGPETLAQDKQTMGALDHTLKIADPVVDALDPGVEDITPAAKTVDPALSQLIPLLNQARPTLVSLRPALEKLSHAGTVGTPLLKSMVPTFNVLNKTTLPGFSKQGFTGLKMYEAIGPVFASVSSGASEYDANGHVERFQALAAGADSASFLPCDLNLSQVKLNCDDLESAIGTLLGMSPSSLEKQGLPTPLRKESH